MERKTEDQLLTEYIDKYHSDYSGELTKDEYFRKIVSDTYGFASYRVNHYASVLGSTMKAEMTLSIDKAKKTFENLANKLKNL